MIWIFLWNINLHSSYSCLYISYQFWLALYYYIVAFDMIYTCYLLVSKKASFFFFVFIFFFFLFFFCPSGCSQLTAFLGTDLIKPVPGSSWTWWIKFSTLGVGLFSREILLKNLRLGQNLHSWNQSPDTETLRSVTEESHHSSK